MSSLRSALDEYTSEELRYLSDQELSDSLVELERTSGAIEAERARRVGEAAARALHTRDGHLSTTSWLARLLRIPASVAARYHRWGRALERLPWTRVALAEGEITSSAASLLVHAAERHPGPFERDERVLVDAARTLGPRDLGRALAYWGQLADAEAASREEALRRERRRLHASPTLDGMVRVDGDLDPEGGQVVLTALRAEMDTDSRWGGTDDRTPPQRRADALVQICRRYLDSADRPTVAGERPHVVVTLDLESLEGRAGRRCELEDAGVLSPEVARRIACDASVSRVITRGRSEPLDVGRRTPVVSPALRRALIVRDGGCRFPGCGRPPCLVRRAPCSPLGRQRQDLAREPGVVVPTPSLLGASWLPDGGGLRPDRVLPAGRHPRRRPSPAGVTLAASPSLT